MRKMMKKCLIILLMIFMYGCQPKEEVRILVPQGSPAMTILGLDQHTYAVDIVNGPDPLVAAFSSGSHDAIIAPTNLGLKLFQSKDLYPCAAIVVWGNYHLVSSRFDIFDMDDLKNQEIIVFGQNQTSDIILKHVLESYEITANITYVDSVANASALYVNNPNQIVMVAEPSLSKLKVLVPETKHIDLQIIYQSLHQDQSYPQAALFVHRDLSIDKIKKLLDDLETSINEVNEEKEDLIMYGVSLNIVDQKDILKNAISSSHLYLTLVEDAKNEIDKYLDIILRMNPALIGGSIPDETFYWSDAV